MFYRPFWKLLFVALALLAAQPVAFAKEPYYWRDSYGRGVGTGVQANCGSDQYDAGLCYPKCKDGYNGVGPVCWKDKSILSYGRGVGRVPEYNCGGKQADAGLCYEQCKAGYKGAGPVCWGIGPPGYVECGAGYAESSVTCAEVTGGQAVAVGMLIATAVPAAMEAANKAKQASMGPEAVEEAGRLSKMMEPVMARLRPTFEDMAKNSEKVAVLLKKVKEDFYSWIADDPEQAKQIVQAAKYLAKYTKGTASATDQAINGPEGAIDFLRLITTITGIMDPTPVSGVISAFAYPVYVPPPAFAPGLCREVVCSWDYLYSVSGGDLYYYRLDAGGNWGSVGRIGTGWGNMRIVTAGAKGELYALDPQGNLYFYKHDASLQWRVAGEKIGFGFGNMKTIVAGGNYHDGVERRVLYALGNDGTLWYYRFGETPSGAIDTPLGVQIGWGWADCAKLFAGPGGVVYCIKGNGDLMRYAYDPRSPTDRTPVGAKVGAGWNAFSRVFAGAGGQIYAVRPSGALLAYRDIGGSVIGPQTIGSGWNLPQTTALKNW